MAAQQGHQLTFRRAVGDVYKVLTFCGRKQALNFNGILKPI